MKRKHGFDPRLNVELNDRANEVFRLSLRRAGLRCPKWARSDVFIPEFFRIYKRAQVKTHFQRQGERWHVDHIVPLKGEKVCGLHVPWNLHVIPATVNIAKRTMIVTEWLNRDVNSEHREREKQQREKRERQREDRRAYKEKIMNQVRSRDYQFQLELADRLATKGTDYERQFRFVTDGL